MMLQLFAFFLLCSGALAQVPAFGRCPKVAAVQNFNLSQYLNVWYQAEKYFDVSEIGAKCITNNITSNTDGTIKIVKKMSYPTVGNPTTSEYKAKFSGSNTEGKWNVSSASDSGSTADTLYWILDTDYTNYTVTYKCDEYFFFHAKNVWIWTRQQEAPQAALDQAYKVLAKYKISKDQLTKTDQKDCKT